MNSAANKLLFVFAWLILLVVVYFAFGQVLLHPSLRIFQVGGDGVKNYFTFLHHALYDDGAWFQHMNYPYGENIMYLDGQPLLSYILQLFHKHFGLQKHGIVAVLNLAPFLAFLLAILYTYKIFYHYKLSGGWAFLFAILTVLMSPQVLRFSAGHYALSYACVIPMLLYWLIQFDENRKAKYILYIAILTSTVVMLHPYYFAIALVLCGLYCLSILFSNKEALHNRLYAIVLLVAALGIPVIVVKIYTTISDPITDRPEFPHGFIEYRSHLKDFLGSEYSLITSAIKNNWDNSEEGLGYPGIAVIVVFVVMICSIILTLFRGSNTFKSPMPVKWLFIAFASAACALAVPFSLGLEQYIEYLGPFRQFRTLGRFAWIFQFLFCIYSIVWLYHYCRARLSGKIWKQSIILSSVFLIWATDAAGYVLFINKAMSWGAEHYRVFHYWGQKDVETFLSEHNYKVSDFQAIIAIPFSYVGADKVVVGEDANMARSYAIRASVNTGLPVVNALMARTSWSQAFNMVKIAGGPYVDKQVFRMMKSKKPLLLIYDGFEPIHNEDKYLLEHAVYLDTLQHYRIYVCYPDSILKADKMHKEYAKSIFSMMHATDTLIGCDASAIFSKRFDEKYTRAHFAGSGALINKDGLSDTIAIWSNIKSDDTTQFEFSCWFLLDKADYRTPQLTLDFYNCDGKKLKRELISARHSTDNMSYWFRTALFFYMPNSTTSMVCSVIRPSNHIRNFIALDEMLIKPHKTLYISKRNDGMVLVNNHILVK